MADPSPPDSPSASGSALAVGSESLSPSVIDMDIFSQLLEMDDDEEDREFSREIVWNYFSQAETTFEEMEKANKEKNLSELSTLGHFLKGSSAAVGVIKVRDSCENMQHYGKSRDKDGVTELTQDEALKRVVETLESVKADYKEAEAALRGFFDAHEKAAEEAEGEEAAKAVEEADVKDKEDA